MITSVMVGCGEKVSFNENVAALVNDKEVMLDEVTVYLRELESLFEMRYGLNIWDQKDNEGKSTKDMVKESAVDAAIRGFIIEEIAANKKITLTDEESKEIDDNVKQYFEMTDKKKVEENNITEEMIKRIFTVNKLNEKLMESEMKEFKLEKESIKEALKMATYLDPRSVKMYETIQEFGYKGASDKVRARHILIRTQQDIDVEDGKESKEEDVEKAKEEAKKEAKKKAEEVLAKVKAGDDFAALAKEFSDDGSAEQGGDLGEFTRGQMVDAFEDAAFALEVGQTSDLVESEFGYHIIKLEEKIDATEEEIQQKKDIEKLIEEQVTQMEKQQSFEDLYTEWKKEYKISINKELLKTVKIQQSRNNVPENNEEDKANGEEAGKDAQNSEADKNDEGTTEDTNK
jgi:foldase protein PrsA